MWREFIHYVLCTRNYTYTLYALTTGVGSSINNKVQGHLEDRWETIKKTPGVQRILGGGGWPKSILTGRSAWNKRLNPTLGCLY